MGDDRGDPVEEFREYKVDPSWADEIKDFSTAIINNREITEGNSSDAYKTMKLVYDIYCADVSWQKKWALKNSVE